MSEVEWSGVAKEQWARRKSWLRLHKLGTRQASKGCSLNNLLLCEWAGANQRVFCFCCCFCVVLIGFVAVVLLMLLLLFFLLLLLLVVVVVQCVMRQGFDADPQSLPRTAKGTRRCTMQHCMDTLRLVRCC